MKKLSLLNLMRLGGIAFVSLLISCSTGNNSPSTPPAPQIANTIAFSPAVILVNNPLGSAVSGAQRVTLTMKAVDANGKTIQPTASNPLHINVYGAPAGVISPESAISADGSITFTYNGAAFPNNILVNAWINNNANINKNVALGVTQILMKNTPTTCITNSESYAVPLTASLPSALQIKASVGSNTSLNNMQTYTLDTGSLGVIMPISDIPTDGSAIGPGAFGSKFYNSSGNTFAGHYYLTQVNIQSGNNVIRTQPIMVLAVESAYCSGPRAAVCRESPPVPNLHYIGVGFDRNSTESNDLFTSPSANAFLHITNSQNGTNITPGYYLTAGESNTPGLVLGITDTSRYTTVNLTPNLTVPADFNPQPGCYAFPNITGATFCGNALLDIGIAEMFIDLPESQWPASAVVALESGSFVPLGTDMTITMGLNSSPAMSYSYTVAIPPPNESPTPAYVQWINSANIFVNTGRRALYNYNYLYNGQCGQVGFQALK